jgi:hypothetical protein
LNVQSAHPHLAGCLSSYKHADFIAFDEAFFGFLGREPGFEIAYSFPSNERGNVHEAPVFVAESNELVFADTSVVGWLYALDVDTFQVCTIAWVSDALRDLDDVS